MESWGEKLVELEERAKSNSHRISDLEADKCLHPRRGGASSHAPELLFLFRKMKKSVYIPEGYYYNIRIFPDGTPPGSVPSTYTSGGGYAESQVS